MTVDYDALEKRVSEMEAKAKEIVERRNALKVATEVRSQRKDLFYNTKLNIKGLNTMETRNISAELLEKRAVTLSSTGSVIADSELVRLVKSSHKVLSNAKFYYGANGTIIPVQAAAASAPSAQAEADFATQIGITNNLAMTAISLTPAEDVAGLAITDYALRLSAVDEGQLLQIFAEAFGDKWDAAIQAELKKATNVAAANKITAAASGYAAWADVLPLASKLRAKSGNFKLYMTAEQRTALEREQATGYDFAAEELYKTGKIKGLEVVELDVADSTTAGDVLIFASDLSKNYAVGLAQDVMVEYVPTMHAGKCYKGTAFIDHKFINASNNWCIVAHA